MGRKIPAKKHRGVKDPLEQQARRLQSLKGKINAPPKDPDEQPVPRSLTRLFAFRDTLNHDTKKKSKSKRRFPKEGDAAPGGSENPIAHLKKLPGESGRGFSLRINSAMRALHDPLEQHYPQDIEVEDSKGEQMAAQRARRSRKRARAGGDRSAPPAARAQRLALERSARKEKAAEEQARPEVVVERVAFGEVAHAPPALPVRPRRAPAAAPPRARRLLLGALLAGGGGGAGAGAEGGEAEAARLAAVAAYRALKKQRLEEKQRGAKKKKNR